MKIKKIIIALGLMICTLISSCANSLSIKKNTYLQKNNADTQADVIVTMKDLADFLLTKDAHYPLSDEFIERCQQKDGGYIENAKKAGIVVDKQLHSPDQKWHFFESWYYPSISDQTMLYTDSAESRAYKKLLCPELLLWMYEACEVNPEKVRKAKDVAEKAKVDGTHISTMASNMRKCVLWEDMEPAILRFMGESVNPYNVTVNENTGFEVVGLENQYYPGSEVSFSVNVLDNTKALKEVKVNDETIEPINSLYKFTMPRSDVSIVITLQEIIKATNINLDYTTLELNVGDKNKVVTATVIPENTTDSATWEILEGHDLISISTSNNQIRITALKEGIAKIKVTYNENVYKELTINISPSQIATNITQAKYNATYDLGGKKTAKALKTEEEILAALVFDGEGNDILTSISNFSYVYGGGYGSGWSANDLIKIGTTSVNGSITFELSNMVNRVIISGYTYATNGVIRVGDSNSTDWLDTTTGDGNTTSYKCSTISVVGEDAVTHSNVSTFTLDISTTNSVRFDTTNKKPFFITSIEFIYYVE